MFGTGWYDIEGGRDYEADELEELGYAQQGEMDANNNMHDNGCTTQGSATTIQIDVDEAYIVPQEVRNVHVVVAIAGQGESVSKYSNISKLLVNPAAGDNGLKIFRAGSIVGSPAEFQAGSGSTEDLDRQESLGDIVMIQHLRSASGQSVVLINLNRPRNPLFNENWDAQLSDHIDTLFYAIRTQLLPESATVDSVDVFGIVPRVNSFSENTGSVSDKLQASAGKDSTYIDIVCREVERNRIDVKHLPIISSNGEDQTAINKIFKHVTRNTLVGGLFAAVLANRGMPIRRGFGSDKMEVNAFVLTDMNAHLPTWLKTIALDIILNFKNEVLDFPLLELKDLTKIIQPTGRPVQYSYIL